MQDELLNILNLRDRYEILTDNWCKYDNMKIQLLEKTKPATREKCLFYYSEDIKNMPDGFYKSNKLPRTRLYTGCRSSLEYNSGMTRHIIPYVAVKYGDEYYFTIRVGGGETRLLNKIGCLGGHVSGNIDNGMMRELAEEADITDNKIKYLKMHGFIKSVGNVKDPLDVSRDHLGLAYTLTLRRKNIREEEDNTLKGIWVHKDNLKAYYDQAEDWLKILMDNGVVK